MALSACQKDPLATIEEGSWNKEKRLIGISFENQAGDATISINTDDISKGTAGVTIVNPDMASGLKVTKLEVSYGATVSVAVGDAIKFDSNNSTTLTVTGHDGGTRTYTVTVTPLTEPFDGTWKINSLVVWGGSGPAWGGGSFDNLTADASWWNTTTGPAAEMDNTLVFTLSGVNDSGQTYGTCTNNAGGDGLYANFVWQSIPKGYDVGDVNYNYRRIPKGESTWTHDYTSNTITFTQGSETHTATVLHGTSVTNYGKTLDIPNYALQFDDMKVMGGWGPIYTAYDQIIYMPYNYFILIGK
jgi:hypothetical protein